MRKRRFKILFVAVFLINSSTNINIECNIQVYEKFNTITEE